MRRLPAPALLVALPLALAGCSLFREPRPTYVVFFDQGSTALDDPARGAIADAARAANATPSLAVTISSYVPVTGTTNAAESARAQTRADLVASQLAADGVRADRLRRVPPSPDTQTPSGVASRRVEIDIRR